MVLPDRHAVERCAPASAPLYEVEWEGLDDYISDAGLDGIAALQASLPTEFDLGNVQAHRKSVTLTVKFDSEGDPFARTDEVVNLLRFAMFGRTLVANLRAARSALRLAAGEVSTDAE